MADKIKAFAAGTYKSKDALVAAYRALFQDTELPMTPVNWRLQGRAFNIFRYGLQHFSVRTPPYGKACVTPYRSSNLVDRHETDLAWAQHCDTLSIDFRCEIGEPAWRVQISDRLARGSTIKGAPWEELNFVTRWIQEVYGVARMKLLNKTTGTFWRIVEPDLDYLVTLMRTFRFLYRESVTKGLPLGDYHNPRRDDWMEAFNYIMRVSSMVGHANYKMSVVIDRARALPGLEGLTPQVERDCQLPFRSLIDKQDMCMLEQQASELVAFSQQGFLDMVAEVEAECMKEYRGSWGQYAPIPQLLDVRNTLAQSINDLHAQTVNMKALDVNKINVPAQLAGVWARLDAVEAKVPVSALETLAISAEVVARQDDELSRMHRQAVGLSGQVFALRREVARDNSK